MQYSISLSSPAEDHNFVILFEVVDQDGGGVITQWRSGLQTKERARLDAKMAALRRREYETFEEAYRVRLVEGPLPGQYRHLYKIKVKGNPQLRPLLCRAANPAEANFLAGAKEKQGVLVPRGVEATADANRIALGLGKMERVCYET